MALCLCSRAEVKSMLERERERDIEREREVNDGHIINMNR